MSNQKLTMKIGDLRREESPSHVRTDTRNRQRPLVRVRGLLVPGGLRVSGNGEGACPTIGGLLLRFQECEGSEGKRPQDLYPLSKPIPVGGQDSVGRGCWADQYKLTPHSTTMRWLLGKLNETGWFVPFASGKNIGAL